jgi:CRISPR-associated exonuclease Cas4
MSSGPNTEGEVIVIAALNQYVFCPRRCALMFVEGVWSDNEHTAQGTLLHEHADKAGYETDSGATLLRGLPVFSRRYGIAGKADIVEVREVNGGGEGSQPGDARIGVEKEYAPVEYKKGRRRRFENDDVQLCAQALCLEEMFGVTVPAGFIYHAASKRRRKVVFDEGLRHETERTIQAVRELMAEGKAPAAVLLPRCDGCSVRQTCMPELTGERPLRSYDRSARELWSE